MSTDRHSIRPPVGYIAYIDESGDDGIRRVTPIDEKGATEWFCLSAVVIKLERETEVVSWVRDMVSALKLRQRRDIHFRDLGPEGRALVCERVADLPIRCFTVLSNKQNMRGYRNENAEKIPSKNWFYCWITRLLLERVTDFCDRRSIADYSNPRTVRLEFSRRGGMSYSQMRAYLTWLRIKSEAGALFLSQGDLSWSAVDEAEVEAYDHKLRAGLQLADVVASAFYQAVKTDANGTSDPQYAMLLQPRMCPNKNGNVFGYSVKMMPNYRYANLAPHQQRIFEFYRRADKERRAPGP